MPSTILIRVVGPATGGKGLTPVQNAQVTLVTEALLRQKPFGGSTPQPYWMVDGQFETHKHDANGFYVLDAGKVSASFPGGTNLDPAPGNWLLCVQANGMSPVAQRVALKAVKGFLRTSAGWNEHPSDKGQTPPSRTAATVDIAHFAKGADKKIPAEHTVLTVTLYPRSEVVFLCGVDYEVADRHSLDSDYTDGDQERRRKPQAGTRFELFAESRRKDLVAAGDIDNGARATFLNARTGIRSTTVRAVSGWLTVDLERTGTHRFDPASISILDLYKYLDAVGAQAPATVNEVSIFSHAWVGGPILRDTNDRSGSAIERDPKDKDARPKDWNPSGVMASYPKLASAFSASGCFRTWGCNHPVLTRSQIQAALARLKKTTPAFSRTELFSAVSIYEDHQKKKHFELETATLDQVRFSISRNFNFPTGARSYLGAAAHYLTVPCWGAPTGAGANYVNNRMVITAAEGDPVLEYLGMEFSLPAAAIEGRYINYQALKSVTASAPSFTPGRWYGEWPDDRIVAGRAGPWSVVKLHNGTRTFRPASVRVTTTTVTPPIVAGSPGVLFVFSGSTPDKVFRFGSPDVLFLKRDPDFDSGLFVQQNGKVWVVHKRLNHGTWQVYTSEIIREKLRRPDSEANIWISSGSLPPLVGGLLVDSNAVDF
jgi:hypothetical protein